MTPRSCSNLPLLTSGRLPWSFSQAAAPPLGGLPTRLVPPCAGLAHRLSWWPSPPRLTRFVLTGHPSTCPSLGRAGAADHPESTVSSGQPRTTTPQVNLLTAWQRDRLDLAYTTRSPIIPPAAPPPVGVHWLARNRQKPRISKASQVRRLNDSPLASRRIGSGTAAWLGEGVVALDR